MEEQNTNGSAPDKKTEPKKTIVIARQRTFIFKAKGFLFWKKSPAAEECDKIINDWIKHMNLNGQPPQLGKYLSHNGGLVYIFLYSERINVD